MEPTQVLKVKVQIEVTKSHMTSLLCYPPPGYDMNTVTTDRRLQGGLVEKRKEGIKEGMRTCGKEE